MAVSAIDITPTDEQAFALSKIKAWYQNGKSEPFVLTGYAGTGKSTIIPFAVGELGLDWSRVILMTFTGKAATVMTEKSGRQAHTIHSQIYKPNWTQDPKTKKLRLDWELNEESAVANASLVVIDEMSMVDHKMLNDLRSYGVPIIMLGDDFQLPPISGKEIFDEYPAQAVLQEVHRQALTSPILRQANEIRQGGALQKGKQVSEDETSTLSVIPYREIYDQDFLDSDVVITYYNKSRRRLNNWFRQQYGRDGLLPVEGDRIICLRNQRSLNIYNGLLGVACEDAREVEPDTFYELEVHMDNHENPQHLELVDTKVFKDETTAYDPAVSQIDYGYALTGHKSQGSQFDKGIILLERPTKKVEDRRWLYTTLTRFAKHATVALKN